MVKRLLTIAIAGVILLLPAKLLAESEQSTPSERDIRLQQAVTDNGITLDDNAKAQLAGKCVNAQAYLREIQADSDQLVRQRVDTYGLIQKELQAIKLRMTRQGADASETDLMTGKLQQALDDFRDQAKSYKLALDDVTGVDCQQQPEEFKAGLILMRVQRAKLLDTATALKNIVYNSNENIFSQLKKRLEI